jgi:hypothetical protein
MSSNIPTDFFAGRKRLQTCAFSELKLRRSSLRVPGSVAANVARAITARQRSYQRENWYFAGEIAIAARFFCGIRSAAAPALVSPASGDLGWNESESKLLRSPTARGSIPAPCRLAEMEFATLGGSRQNCPSNV